ncbi:MAG: glycosyltransferase family 39 protein [Rhodospirillaceae bacterium]|nr:glycosyltransferase family 39 protein [Rhodospirillaceae bacterium]
MAMTDTRVWLWAPPASALTFAVFHIWFAWIGFVQSDDLYYAVTAEAWAESGPTLAVTHWGLRHTIVLPTAALFAAFGAGEDQLMATAVLYAAALLGFAYVCTDRVGGPVAASIAVTCMIAVPMMASGASFLTADMPEAVYMIGSVVAFHYAWRSPRPWLFLFAGALAGVAAITRETTACLLLFYGLLFAANYGGNRMNYFWMVPGFIAVFGADTVVLWAASGDPLYRFTVTLGGVEAVNSDLLANNRAAEGFDDTGVLSAPRWLKPIVMLLANQQIGPLTWIGIPSMVAVITSGRDRPHWRLPRLLALFAATWFVCTTYVLYNSLYLIPRYQIVSIAIMAMCVGLVLAEVRPFARRVAAGIALLGVAGAGILLTGASDRTFMYSEREVVRIAQSTSETVWTDPASRIGAEWLLKQNDDGSRVVAGIPPPGGLFIYNSRPRRPLPGDWPLRIAPPDWTIVAETREPVRPFVPLLKATGLWRFLPDVVIRKLDPEPRMTRLLRRPADRPMAN